MVLRLIVGCGDRNSQDNEISFCRLSRGINQTHGQIAEDLTTVRRRQSISAIRRGRLTLVLPHFTFRKVNLGTKIITPGVIFSQLRISKDFRLSP